MTLGWIALDIDGTVAEGLNAVPAQTAAYLDKVHKAGWNLVFITGRTFSFAHRALGNLPFPHYLAVQNGADILLMPERKLVDQRYLDSDAIHRVENAYRGQKEDFIIYAGFEHGDFCYYRPKHFSADFQPYLEMVMSLAPEPWQPLDSFSKLEGKRFPLIKCIGNEEGMRLIEKKLRAMPGLEVISIRDPLDANLHLVLVSDREASKGCVLDRLFAITGSKKKHGRIIAAGDDRNDLSMLAKADVRIVMSTAPKEVQKEADILAKPAKEHGIIDALRQATGVQ